MAIEQYNNTKTIDTNSVVSPRISQTDMVKSNGLDNMIQTLGNFLAQGTDQINRQKLTEAKKAGAAAGFSDNPQLKDSQRLVDETFNNAAIETFVNKTTVDVSTRVNSLANDPHLKSQPDKLRAALDNLEGGYLRNMPPDAITPFRLQYNNETERAVQNAQVQQYAEQLDAAKGSFMEADHATSIDILNAAREGNLEYVDKKMQFYHGMLDRQGHVGAGGTGVLDSAEIVKRKLAMDNEVKSQLMIGKLERTPDDQKAHVAETMINDPDLKKYTTPDEREQMEKEVVSAFDAHTEVLSKVNAQNKVAQKAEAKGLENDFVLHPDENKLISLIQHPGFDGSPFQAYQHLQSTIKDSNPIIYKNTDQLIAQGRFQEARDEISLTNEDTVDQISGEDRTKLMTRIIEGEQGAGFEATEGWKEAMRRVEADNRQENALFAGAITPEGEAIRRQMYDEMRTQWPQYKNGTLTDMPDPVRLYNMKKQASVDTAQAASKNTITISTGENVVIPQKWVDDPNVYAVELKNRVPMAPRFTDHVFIDYMTEKALEKSKGAKK